MRPLRGNERGLDRMVAWLRDRVAADMLNVDASAWNTSKVRAYVSRHDPTLNPLIGLFAKIDGGPSREQLIGFHRVQVNWIDLTALVDVIIGEREWRQSTTRQEAGIAFNSFLFTSWGLWKLKAHVKVANVGMRVLLQMAGWQKEAHLRGHILGADGAGRDDVEVYGILRREWEQILIGGRPKRVMKL